MGIVRCFDINSDLRALGLKKICVGKPASTDMHSECGRQIVRAGRLAPNKGATYTAEEIMGMLQLKRTSAYEWLREIAKTGKPFRVLKIGKLYRVPRKDFDDWFNGGGG